MKQVEIILHGIAVNINKILKLKTEIVLNNDRKVSWKMTIKKGTS